MLKDVQKEYDSRNIYIHKVGIEDLEYPINFEDNGIMHNTIADFSAAVSLNEKERGTHMSRFIELINEIHDNLSINRIPQIMEKMQEKFSSDLAFLEFKFPIFLLKEAPNSKKSSFLKYECKLSSNRSLKELDVNLEVNIPIHSLCPCSKEISKYGAHNQRGIVTVVLKKFKLDISIASLITSIESCSSTQIYSLLKRVDEQYVTEKAYENPRFVEDIVREIALLLNNNVEIEEYFIKTKNFESIHNHNAFAIVKKEREFF